MLFQEPPRLEGGGDPVITPQCVDRYGACGGSLPSPAVVHTCTPAQDGPSGPGAQPPLGLGHSLYGLGTPRRPPPRPALLREAGGFEVPTVARAGPTALRSASAPRGTARRASPRGRGPLNP